MIEWLVLGLLVLIALPSWAMAMDFRYIQSSLSQIESTLANIDRELQSVSGRI